MPEQVLSVCGWDKGRAEGGWVMVCAIPGAMSECGVPMQR